MVQTLRRPRTPRAPACTAGALLLAACCLGLLLPTSTAHAHPWKQGSVRVSIGGGIGTLGGETAVILGAGAGYNVLDGLEVGLDADRWFGGAFGLTRVTPGLEYVLWMVPVLQPYAGTFFRHWFVSGADNLSSVGVRAGVYTGGNSRLLLGLGVVREAYLGGCDLNCTDWYPEIRLSFRF